MIKRISTLLALMIVSVCGFAQPDEDESRMVLITSSLEDYARNHKEIREKVNIVASGSLKDLVTAIVHESKTNLTIDPGINQQLTFNFSDVPVQDILLFLCRQYCLDLKYSGAIISLVPCKPKTGRTKGKEPLVEYTQFNNRLTLDLKADTLGEVLKRISTLSGKNVVATKEVAGNIVNGYIGKTELETALEQLAVQNELGLQKTGKDYYILGKKAGSGDKPSNGSGFTTDGKGENFTLPEGLKMEMKDSLLNLTAVNVAFGDILKAVSFKMGKDYIMFSAEGGDSPGGPIGANKPGQGGAGKNGAASTTLNLKLTAVSFEDFLTHILTGTSLTWSKQGRIYLIGSRNMEDFRTTKVYQFQYRSLETIEEQIPDMLKQDIILKPFSELNSLVICGSAPATEELLSYLAEIDRAVPVVSIEMTILDINRGHVVQTGIKAGIGNPPPASGGTLFPSVDFTFSSEGINSLLSFLAGKGIVNLGAVNENFYLQLQALENNNYLKLRSRPQLSTLNSHEATFTIGETKNYLNEQTVISGGVTAITNTTRQVQTAEANFTIKVTPFVSGNEQITLDISVDQSRFGDQTRANLPPDKTTRKFTSKIRVQNCDMIVLGGLEDFTIQESGSGTPILSRIPILKWFFSSRKRAREKRQLLIFVKPTVIYE